MIKHSIGETIAALRKSKGWTQIELAKRLNVTDKTVSKWESKRGLPEIEQFPILAKLFDVSIDYLMTGKVDEQISLDDMDSVKRMFYLIKKDDVENYIKYDYPAKTYFNDFNGGNSAIACIIEHKSKKIFNACVENGIALKTSRFKHYTSLVGALYEHIDDLIKMACEADCLEFLKKIDFLSFSVASVRFEHSRFSHTDAPKAEYLVSPETFEFIFTSPTISNRIIEYISTYRTFQPRSISYGTSVSDFGKIIKGTFYFLEQNIIEQLYKTKKFELLSNYIRQIELDTTQTTEISKRLEPDSQVFYNLKNGYLLRNDTGYMGRTTVIGKLITIDKQIIDLSISNLDEYWTKAFIEYNRTVVKNATSGILRYESKVIKAIFAPTDHELALLFDDAKHQKRIRKIKGNSTITDKQRREQLFEENAITLSDVVLADDYDLFALFPKEVTNKITLMDIVNADCKDVRFYIHAVNVDNDINNLNSALKTVLEKHPERYDILDILLSAGAIIDENLAFTNILKQNVALCLNKKETTIANIEVDNNVSKEELLNALSDGKLEYVIVNLTIILEKKLKIILAEQNIDLIAMIDKIHSNGTMSDFDYKMLHNLRKARNGIVHQSGKFYYTKPIVKAWVEIVYSLQS